MKIYTKTGDQGSTSLIGGRRVSKAHLRVETYGNVDELNAYIGLIKDYMQDESANRLLLQVQHHLFVIGSLLAAETGYQISLPQLPEKAVSDLEQAIDLMQESLPSLTKFVLPGGHPVVSHIHITRCVCRRAERAVVQLQQEVEVEEIILIFLNRLSDYLFVLSRSVGQQLGVQETYWKGKA